MIETGHGKEKVKNSCSTQGRGKAVGGGEVDEGAAEVCRVAVKEVEVKKPDSQSASFYAKRYQVYRSLYPALKQTFQTIGELDA